MSVLPGSRRPARVSGKALQGSDVDDGRRPLVDIRGRGVVAKAALAVEVDQDGLVAIPVAVEVEGVAGAPGIRARIHAWRAEGQSQIIVRRTRDTVRAERVETATPETRTGKA